MLRCLALHQSGRSLSAGAIGTPHILQLSGVSDPNRRSRRAASCVSDMSDSLGVKVPCAT